MAGMLAGVESARMRRIHQNIVYSSFSSSPTGAGAGAGASLCLRRSLFLHAYPPAAYPSLGRSRPNEGLVDEKLGQLARQAKERLDGKLRAKSKSIPSRNGSTTEGRKESGGNKKKKITGWGAGGMARLGGGGAKSKREPECVICLEDIRRKEQEVMSLECSHTFHRQCVVPWLHFRSICPCCRTPTSSSSS